MKKKQIIYTQILGAIASIFVALGIKHMIELFAASENIVQDVSVFVILIIITALCRSLPLRIKDDEDIDMSFIIIFAMVLTQGWKYAVCVILLHTFFSVIKSDEHNGKYVSLIKYSVLKCCFNTSNYIICTSIGGIVWGLCGGVSGQPALGLPYSMLPSAAFVLVMISVNSLLLLGILSFTNNFKFLKTFFSMMLQFLPNMILSASMGYFFALMLSLESG